MRKLRFKLIQSHRIHGTGIFKPTHVPSKLNHVGSCSWEYAASVFFHPMGPMIFWGAVGWWGISHEIDLLGDDFESKNPKDLFHWPPVRVMETSWKNFIGSSGRSQLKFWLDWLGSWALRIELRPKKHLINGQIQSILAGALKHFATHVRCLSVLREIIQFDQCFFNWVETTN